VKYYFDLNKHPRAWKSLRIKGQTSGVMMMIIIITTTTTMATVTAAAASAFTGKL